MTLARDLTRFLGRQVRVIVDRPLGCRHPRHPDLIYPVNYGFVPETVSGDGMEADAYLLGIDKPIAEAEGTVIAVIIRADDVEDKLVVAPAGRHFSPEQITALVGFQERFFESSVVPATLP